MHYSELLSLLFVSSTSYFLMILQSALIEQKNSAINHKNIINERYLVLLSQVSPVVIKKMRSEQRRRENRILIIFQMAARLLSEDIGLLRIFLSINLFSHLLKFMNFSLFFTSNTKISGASASAGLLC